MQRASGLARRTWDGSPRLVIDEPHFGGWSRAGSSAGRCGTGKGKVMRLRVITIWAALALLAVGTSAQSASTAAAGNSKDQPSPRQVKVIIDPRSSEGMERSLLTNGFRDVCPNVSIVRDESKAEYVIVASVCAAGCGWLTHFYITVYDKQGKVAFATDKVDSERSTKAVCRFFNAQK
jgi:hypothetical protein